MTLGLGCNFVFHTLAQLVQIVVINKGGPTHRLIFSMEQPLKECTKLPDLFNIILKKKWQWAGHIARMSDNWALELTTWKPTTKRHPGNQR